MRFWSWYVMTMRGLLPQRLLRERRGGLIVAAGLDGTADARVTVLRRGGDVALGTLGRLAGERLAAARIAARQGVTIRLAADTNAVLTRTAALPLAAERELAVAVAHEMDALTPFDAAEVYFRLDRLRRDRERGMIRLRLAILPRAMVAPVIAALAQAGFAATRIEAALPDRDVVFPIDDGGQRGPRLAGPAIACAVLAVVCLAIPLIRQQLVLEGLAAQRQAIAAPLRTAAMLRRRLVTARTGTAALEAERRREGDALAALAALTAAVPDGSFLSDISLRHRIATLDGLSPDAAGLVAKLSADPAFADPGFTAPVTRALNARADIFALKVRLRDVVR